MFTCPFDACFLTFFPNYFDNEIEDRNVIRSCLSKYFEKIQKDTKYSVKKLDIVFLCIFVYF